jgi:acyl-CoA synthetase (AMP-forming)/AMP-acid ligase II
MAPTSVNSEARLPGVNENFCRAILQLEEDLTESEKKGVGSLPELIQFNAVNNPTHLFALQQIRKDGQHLGFHRVTYQSLLHAVEECADWLKDRVTECSVVDDAQRSSKECRPVALFLESDMTLFIYLCALLWMDIPVSGC